jgi:hypothetical protein
MTKAKQTSGKVFHGWWVVLVAGVGVLSATVKKTSLRHFHAN